MARAKTIDDGDFLTPEDYLAAEQVATVRHEYIDGFVFAMAGARERHNVLKLALASLLETHFDEPCRVFDGDMKLRSVRGKSVRFYYPDIFVSCGDADDEQIYRGDAVLAVEVLSPSTEREDRTSKFERYKLVPSMLEIVLVLQKRMQIEVYRRRNRWQREIFESGDRLKLESIDFECTVERVYRRLRM